MAARSDAERESIPKWAGMLAMTLSTERCVDSLHFFSSVQQVVISDATATNKERTVPRWTLTLGFGRKVYACLIDASLLSRLCFDLRKD